MSTENRKTQPCNTCRWRKVKCIKAQGETRCSECIKRNEECERRTGSPTANSTPCEECKKAHVACDWPGSGTCARCSHLRLPCTHCGAATGSGISPASPKDGAPRSGSSDSSQSCSKSFFDVVLN